MLLLVLNILLLGVGIWLFRQRKAKTRLKKYFYPALGFKLACGFALGNIYLLYYQGGDTFTHFQQAELLGKQAFSNWQNFKNIMLLGNYANLEGFYYSIQPQSAFFCKLIALVNLLTGNNYWLTGLYFSFFSFMAFWSLAVESDKVLGHLAPLLLLFFPGMVFWTSGVMKETLAVGGMVWVLTLLMQQQNGKLSISRLLKIAMLLLFVFKLKYYFGSLFGAFVLTYLVVESVPRSLKNKKLFKPAMLVVLFLVVLAASRLHPNLYVERIGQVIAANYHSYEMLSSSDKMVQLEGMDGSTLSIVRNAPKALFYGLYAPLLGAYNAFWVLSVLENWFLLILTMMALYGWGTERKFIINSSVFLGIAFVGVMAILLAMTAPNIGTLVRYKTGFLPVFLLLLAAGIGNLPWPGTKGYRIQE